jgi:hypothetical protein
MFQHTLRLLLLSWYAVGIAQGADGLGHTVVFADDTNRRSILFATNNGSYTGGRGLITLEGISGIFLNPTSGTLRQGQLTLQYCVSFEDASVAELVKHTEMIAYGMTDWLEVGAIGRVNDEANAPNTAAFGPLFRIRVLKESGSWPELSIGGVFQEGNENITRQTMFIAVSKAVPADPDGVFRGFRLHGGFRQFWQDVPVDAPQPSKSASLGYIGGEIEFPQYLYLVAEISNNDSFPHIPFAVGLQWRHPKGYGLSLAGLQTGAKEELFVGIGIPFQ